jgi:hypothetical protein
MTVFPCFSSFPVQPAFKAETLASAFGICGAAAVALGSCQVGNLFFALANPPLIAHFWRHGGHAHVVQFFIYECLAILGLARSMGVI